MALPRQGKQAAKQIDESAVCFIIRADGIRPQWPYATVLWILAEDEPFSGAI